MDLEFDDFNPLFTSEDSGPYVLVNQFENDFSVKILSKDLSTSSF